MYVTTIILKNIEVVPFFFTVVNSIVINILIQMHLQFTTFVSIEDILQLFQWVHEHIIHWV